MYCSNQPAQQRRPATVVKFYMQRFFSRITKALIRLCISAGWSASVLFACNKSRLSPIETHILTVFKLCIYAMAGWICKHTAYMKWASAWDFQQCGMCDQQSLRSACAYAQSDQSLCLSLEYSMIVQVLSEHHLEFLSIKGGCRGSSESTLVKLLKISCRGSNCIVLPKVPIWLFNTPMLSYCFGFTRV